MYVEPEVTDVGSDIVTVVVPVLWHIVQVGPVLPEYPAIPPG